ncbi:MAG: rRNA maturation RNase YbeY [Micrococcaceae bacterium]
MLDIINETDEIIDKRDFKRLINFAFQKLYLGKNVELSLMFVDEPKMEELHINWLDLPGPTDVMSFPMDLLEAGTPNNPVNDGILGDIVLCPTVTRAQAKAAGHSERKENCLLVLHGILHLLGHDHYEADEKKVMFELQDKLLKEYLNTFP